MWVSRVKFGLPDVRIRLIYQIRVSPLEREFIKLPVLEGYDGISQWFLLSLRYIILLFGLHLCHYFRLKSGNQMGIGCRNVPMSAPQFSSLKLKILYLLLKYTSECHWDMWYVGCYPWSKTFSYSEKCTYFFFFRKNNLVWKMIENHTWNTFIFSSRTEENLDVSIHSPT